MSEATARRIVRLRSGGVCEGCRSARPGGVHHRQKRSQGGPWSPSNLLDLCGSGTTGCHGWAEANPLHANMLGWSLRRGDVPAEVGALIYTQSLGRATVLLADDGTYGYAGQEQPNPGPWREPWVKR